MKAWYTGHIMGMGPEPYWQDGAPFISFLSPGSARCQPPANAEVGSSGWEQWPVMLTQVKARPTSLHGLHQAQQINSLAPGRCGCNVKLVIFKLTSRVHILSIWCEIALRWMPLDFTDDKSTLVQVMAWCRQATSHYMNQCLPRSVSPYGVTRPKWVNGSYPILRWTIPCTSHTEGWTADQIVYRNWLLIMIEA